MMPSWLQCLLPGLIAVDFILIEAAVPSSPMNITITQLSAKSISIQWDTEVDDQVGRFEVTVRTLSLDRAGDISTETPTHQLELWKHEIILDIDSRQRLYTVKNLRPATEYHLYIIAINTNGRSNASMVITFRTLSGDDGPHMPKVVVNPGEILVVMFLLCAWFCAIGLFLHKWGKIRLSSPSEPRYKHSPKNLDTIKVVKNQTDSVIYKTHHKDSLYTRTMDARLKRIERMNTMPNIKFNLEPKEKQQDKKDSRALGRNKSEPMMELGIVFNREKEPIKITYHPPSPVKELDEGMTSSTGSIA